MTDRFWSKVDVGSEEDCWEWQACKNNKGYGQFHLGGRNVLAHRHAYMLCVGEIPDGLELDHLCRNPICVNPAHLEAVTHRVNTLRSGAVTATHARKTVCVHGHPFDLTNTYLRASGGRECRKCRAATESRRRKRLAATT